MFYPVIDAPGSSSPTPALLNALVYGMCLEPWHIAETLERLYPYKPPSRPRTVEALVALACAGKSAPLKHLQTPLADGEYLLASDGATLHAAASTAPAGKYSRTGERIGDFPAGVERWRDTAAVGALGQGVPFADIKVEFGLSTCGKDYVRAVRVTLPDGEAITVQRAYYDRAITLPGRHVPVRVCILPNRAPTLRVETTCGLAVIAGIRDPNEARHERS